MGEHDGHRARLKKQFDENAQGMTDAQLLELLLYSSIPRRDVRPLAEDILERIGGLPGLSEMEAEALAGLPGAGDSTVRLLELAAENIRRSQAAPLSGTVVSSPEDALRLLKPRLRGVEGDAVFGLFLDERMRVLLCIPVEVTAEELAWQAAGLNARTLILGAGYADGRYTPDIAESRSVQSLREGLMQLEILLADYIVVGRSRYTSLYRDRLLRSEESMRSRYRTERDSSRVSAWAGHFTVHDLPPELSD